MNINQSKAQVASTWFCCSYLNQLQVIFRHSSIRVTCLVQPNVCSFQIGVWNQPCPEIGTRRNPSRHLLSWRHSTAHQLTIIPSCMTMIQRWHDSLHEQCTSCSEVKIKSMLTWLLWIPHRAQVCRHQTPLLDLQVSLFLSTDQKLVSSEYEEFLLAEPVPNSYIMARKDKLNLSISVTGLDRVFFTSSARSCSLISWNFTNLEFITSSWSLFWFLGSSDGVGASFNGINVRPAISW